MAPYSMLPPLRASQAQAGRTSMATPPRQHLPRHPVTSPRHSTGSVARLSSLQQLDLSCNNDLTLAEPREAFASFLSSLALLRVLCLDALEVTDQDVRAHTPAQSLHTGTL